MKLLVDELSGNRYAVPIASFEVDVNGKRYRFREVEGKLEVNLGWTTEAKVLTVIPHSTNVVLLDGRNDV